MWRLTLRLFGRTEIFLSNLPENFNIAELSHIIPPKAEYKLSKSYCFIKISDEIDANPIVASLNSLTLRDKQLRAKVNRFISENQDFKRKQNNLKEEVEPRKGETIMHKDTEEFRRNDQKLKNDGDYYRSKNSTTSKYRDKKKKSIFFENEEKAVSKAEKDVTIEEKFKKYCEAYSIESAELEKYRDFIDKTKFKELYAFRTDFGLRPDFQFSYQAGKQKQFISRD